MDKLKSRMLGMGQMLSKDQMKMITGGASGVCEDECGINAGGAICPNNIDCVEIFCSPESVNIWICMPK